MRRFLALFFGILVRPERVYRFLHGHPAPLKPGLAGGMNGHGRFDMVFAVTALALNAPMFIFMWVPETIVLLSGSIALADMLFPPVVNEIRQLTPPVWNPGAPHAAADQPAAALPGPDADQAAAPPAFCLLACLLRFLSSLGP